MNLDSDFLGERADKLERQLKEVVESIDLAMSKGWTPLNKWIALGKSEADWVDYCEFNKIGEAIKAERESKIKNNKKSKKKNNKARQELTDEIGLLENLIKNGLTINDYLESKKKSLDLIEQLDK